MTRRIRLAPIALVMLALAATACTRSSDGFSTSTSTSISTTTSTPTSSPASVNRLLILEPDGNLATLAPDGSDRIALTEDAGAQLRFLQPTWSPDGTRVAWSQIDARGVAVVAGVATSAVDGSARAEADIGFAPFYMYWDPTAARLAYLGAGEASLELGLLDVAGGATAAATIDGGQPYYFDWAPDGSRMFVHVAQGRLQTMDLEGATTDLGPEPGLFQAPAWRADRLFYVAVDGDLQYLAASDLDGDNERRLVETGGFVYFVASPAGDRIAFQSVGDPDAGVQALGPGTVAAGPSAQGTGTGGLAVLDVATGNVTSISHLPELAFFWSPQGDKLLSLGVALGGDHGSFRWQVWHGGDTFTTDPFLPSVVMRRDYLPFFDQFAKSMTPWAPDGSAFAYAGTGPGGEAGIWVQEARPDVAAVRVADGDFVAWSPA